MSTSTPPIPDQVLDLLLGSTDCRPDSVAESALRQPVRRVEPRWRFPKGGDEGGYWDIDGWFDTDGYPARQIMVQFDRGGRIDGWSLFHGVRHVGGRKFGHQGLAETLRSEVAP